MSSTIPEEKNIVTFSYRCFLAGHLYITPNANETYRYLV